MMMIISDKSKTGEPMRCGDLHEIMGPVRLWEPLRLGMGGMAL